MEYIFNAFVLRFLMAISLTNLMSTVSSSRNIHTAIIPNVAARQHQILPGQNQNKKVVGQLHNSYPIPNRYLYFQDENTKVQGLQDGTVVAYGEKFHLVNIPIMGHNRLVPLSFQYAVRIPTLAFAEQHNIQNESLPNDKT